MLLDGSNERDCHVCSRVPAPWILWFVAMPDIEGNAAPPEVRVQLWFCELHWTLGYELYAAFEKEEAARQQARGRELSG